jgi:hypothetical protein
MNKFIIYLIKGKIQVLYQKDEQPRLLSKEGEEWFEYDTEFWDWFKQKIDYQDEPLSFIIISDQEFEIVKEIKIAEQSGFKEMPILTQYPKTEIISEPRIKENLKKIIQKKQRELSFLDYFVEETEVKRESWQV